MKALITGMNGQDGPLLADLLLNEGHRVYGLVRRPVVDNGVPVHRLDNLYLGDVRDTHRVAQVLEECRPDVIFNLAAQSHVGSSFEINSETFLINGHGAFSMMQAALDVLGSETKFVQACTSDMFADVEGPHNEETPIVARNPYACGKIAAYYAGQYFRNSHHLEVYNAIFFNHESPRRAHTFVTRKVTRAVARIHLKLQDRLELGNLDTARDWGYAGDTVRAVVDILGTPPGDYVVSTGQSTPLQLFVQMAFEVVDLDWQNFVRQNPQFMRRDDYVNPPFGTSKKLHELTGWEPQTSLKDLIHDMVQADIENESVNL